MCELWVRECSVRTGQLLVNEQCVNCSNTMFIVVGIVVGIGPLLPSKSCVSKLCTRTDN